MMWLISHFVKIDLIYLILIIFQERPSNLWPNVVMLLTQGIQFFCDKVGNTSLISCYVPINSYAAFSLACRSPHCCFDDDICTTAQAPLAAEGWPSGKQLLSNGSITLPLCPLQQIADSWILFNLGAMPFSDKAKVVWPLRAVTLKQQAMITWCSGKAAS